MSQQVGLSKADHRARKQSRGETVDVIIEYEDTTKTSDNEKGLEPSFKYPPKHPTLCVQSSLEKRDISASQQ